MSSLQLHVRNAGWLIGPVAALSLGISGTIAFSAGNDSAIAEPSASPAVVATDDTEWWRALESGVAPEPKAKEIPPATPPAAEVETPTAPAPSAPAPDKPGQVEREPKRPPIVVMEQTRVSGKVMFIGDDDNKEVEAIDLTVRIWTAERKLIYETKTDENGQFAIPELEVGMYRMRVGQLHIQLAVKPKKEFVLPLPVESKIVLIFIPRDLG